MNEDGQVLKSRRGLLAAGLTFAVVGTIGFASTLNAGAEQIPDTPAPAAAPADAAEEAPADATAPATVTPPALLPWGEKPRTIRKGRNGASSKSLKESGLSAAPDTVSESRGNRYAPKGQSPRTGYHRSSRTAVVAPSPAPAPSSTAKADPAAPKVYFHYNVGSQGAVAEGAYANLTISRPKLEKADYHTLAEIAVRSADEQHTVEVGWTVDRALNGDDDPHLFVFHWVDGKPACYNTCDFVPWTDIKPGATLPYDTQKRFGIQYAGGAWWVAYDTGWVGYFPGENWGNRFEKSGLVQMFGEVAASSLEPCTQMGNGLASFESKASKIGSVAYLNGPEPEMFVYSEVRGPGVPLRTPSWVFPIYEKSKASARTFRYGGPGCKPVALPED